MKLAIVILPILAELSASAADPSLFAPVPFRLESLSTTRSVGLVSTNGLILPLPIGPVRIDYGQLFSAGPSQPRHPHLDAPGAGYRKQSAPALRP